MRMRFFATSILCGLWLAGPAVSRACETCFGSPGVDTPITRGIGMAMLLLVGMTGMVWGGIGAFFYHVRKRSRLLEPGDTVVDEFGQMHPAGSDND